ncbi:glycosyl hydrolase family 3 N terminal domain-containing protein [Fusarium oxysporum]|nr:glycosyl hydrolase family 3 N terminal domain-containing protein [Fusarium oxysporum]
MDRLVGTIGKVERLGFRGICFSDGPSGYARSDGVSVFSSGLTAAATWDKRLIYEHEHAVAIGEEFRAKGAHVFLGLSCGPMGRSVLGGRNWEGFGPEPYLSGVAMHASVSGIQSVGVQAYSKHFIGNEQGTQRTQTTEEDGTVINALSSNIDERTLHEMYLWPFADAVKAGTASVMCSYNRVNQTYSCANHHLLSIPKNEPAFPGYVVSDWYATHGTASFANAGLDLEMPGPVRADYGASYFGNYLLDAVNDDNVTKSRLNEMVERVLTLYFFLHQHEDFPALDLASATALSVNQFGYNTPQFAIKPVPARDVRGGHAKVIRELGATATNEKVIGVFGNGAPYPAIGSVYFDYENASMSYEVGTIDQGGGSGIVRNNELIVPLDANRESVRKQGGRVQVLLEHKDIIDGKFRSIYPIPDVCLVFLKAFAAEGRDRESPDLDWNATKVVESVASLCSNTVVIVHGPGIVLMPWADNENVTAILSAQYPGEEIGNSIVDVLWGEAEPAGRLPYTIPRNTNDYGGPIFNLTEPSNNPDEWSPQYEFGLGHSFTTYDMSTELTVNVAAGIGAHLDESKGKAPGGWNDLWEQAAAVTVEVRNTGDRDGHAKVHLKAGQAKRVVLPLQRRDLSFWDEATRQWVIPEGTFTFSGGFSSRDLRAKTKISVLG